MELKQSVLAFLENNRGKSISGAKLAIELNVTRSAVWKAIKALQGEGYSILAITNKGYCLSEETDILSTESIKPFLRGQAKEMQVEVFKTIDSTNTYAKKLAQNGAVQGTVIVSEEQSAGRGRLGRSFYSPASTGIYMSVILRPKLSIEHSLLITTSVAVAVSKAIETLARIDTKIKWVNDIYFNEKKLCGILCEASIDFESGGLEYAIVGIGINVSTLKDEFPANLKEIATSIFPNNDAKPIRSELIAEILNNISQCYDDISNKSFLEEYKKRSFLLGQEIFVINGEKSDEATAIDIDEKAQLVVKFKDGSIKTLSSGEVSVRKK